MGIRVLFKVDGISQDSKHVGYERDESGVADRSKPIVEITATVRLSAAEPHNDPKRESDHPNYAVWKGRIAGNLVLTNVDLATAAGYENGKEYFLEISPAS